MRQAMTRQGGAIAVPREVAAAGGLAAALALVVAGGMGLQSLLPHHASFWMYVGAYAFPAAIGFAAYWWVDQRQ